MPNILVVLTSQALIPATRSPTGWYLPELAHPHSVLSPKTTLTLATPEGGEAPLDPSSVQASKTDEQAMSFLDQEKPLWTNTLKLKEVLGREEGFQGLFFVGGHGPMFDLATNPVSLAIIQSFAAAQKPIAAVCHGPAALVNATAPSGTPLLESATVTGFSNVEEQQAGMEKVMPFMLETEMNRVSGGGYVKADQPWGEKVVVSKTAGPGGVLITGQNPASAAGVAKELLKALGA